MKKHGKKTQQKKEDAKKKQGRRIGDARKNHGKKTQQIKRKTQKKIRKKNKDAEQHKQRRRVRMRAGLSVYSSPAKGCNDDEHKETRASDDGERGNMTKSTNTHMDRKGSPRGSS